MRTTVIGIFETAGQVRDVLAELRRAGFSEQDLAVHPPGAAGPGIPLVTGSFPAWARRRCALELARGGRLVAVSTGNIYEIGLIQDICRDLGGQSLVPERETPAVAELLAA